MSDNCINKFIHMPVLSFASFFRSRNDNTGLLSLSIIYNPSAKHAIAKSLIFLRYFDRMSPTHRHGVLHSRKLFAVVRRDRGFTFDIASAEHSSHMYIKHQIVLKHKRRRRIQGLSSLTTHRSRGNIDGSKSWGRERRRNRDRRRGRIHDNGRS